MAHLTHDPLAVTLQDELVDLRPLRPGDREPLYQIASDRLLWAQHQCKDRHERPVFDRLFDDAMLAPGALTVLDHVTERIIGSTRLIEIDPRTIEIGYTYLDRQLWGTGYNQAMKRLLIDHIFQQRKNVVFYVHRGNLRSQKAVCKLGARRILESDDPLLRHRTQDWFCFLLPCSL